MTPITCIGHDGEPREFQFRHEFNQLDNTWDFQVHTVPPLATGGFYEYRVRVLGDGSFQSIWMGSHGAPEFRAMGVSDAIILEAARVLGSPIFSSPALGEPGEFRQPGATKVWQRLVNSGHAIYDLATDTYRTRESF